jgi:hypothetical protein
MNRRDFMTSTAAGLVTLSWAPRVVAQAKTLTPNLAAMADGHQFTLVKRTATRLVEGDRTGIRLNAAEGEGVALLPEIQLANGTIELDVRGKDVPQQSFVGVAFHGADGSAFDVVYFRPFNFKAADPVSRGHAVQYHSTPNYPWDRLRAEQPGKYEQAVTPVPDPNAWFHARIVLADPTVSVFVADATSPCLVVNTLGERKTGLVGLWAGNGSGGDFANLTITVER